MRENRTSGSVGVLGRQRPRTTRQRCQRSHFMIDHNVGISKFVSYEVKRIDSDYFVEE